MDPVSQVLAQSNAGSAQGQGFGDFAVQGRQLANQERGLSLSERRLELEREQEERMSMLAPLQREAMRNQNIATGLQIEAARRAETAALRAKQSEVEVADFMAGLSRDAAWGTPQAWDQWGEIVKRHPEAALTPLGDEFLKKQQVAIANKQLVERFGNSSQVKVPTLEGGEAIYGNTKGPLSTIGKMQADIEAAEAAGNTEAAAALREGMEVVRKRLEISETNAETARLNAEINKKRAESNIDKFTEELPQMDRDLFRAELKALDNRMDLMTDPAKYEQELERVKSKYSTKLPARPSPQSAPSGSAVPRRRWDPITKSIITQ